MRTSRILASCVALTAVLAASTASADGVAILSTTVSGGYSSHEAQIATSAGQTVTVFDPADWQAMSVAQFSDFDALILGDPTCRTGDSYIAAAAANPEWAWAADGNVIIIGADPSITGTLGPVPRSLSSRAFSLPWPTPAPA